jgi:branched-chain amino acid transport system substrate-binding protein
MLDSSGEEKKRDKTLPPERQRAASSGSRWPFSWRQEESMKRVWPLFLHVIAALTLIFSSPGISIGGEPFSLGVALGLTGTGAPYSAEAVEAVELAVNQINARGGLLGRHPIQLFIRDTQTDPVAAVKVVSRLIEEHRVGAIIGTYSSACAMAIKPICRKHRVIHIATISNAEEITKIDFSPYTFSVVPNTYMMARGVVMGIGRLAQERGWKRYATIASDYAWGRSSQRIQVELLRRTAPELSLVGEFWPPLGQTQFNAFIVAMEARQPDFVLGTIGGADNAYFMRDARDYRFFKSVAYPGSLISVSELIRQSTSIRRGRFGRCRAPFFAHLDEAMMARFTADYLAKYDRYPTDWAVMSYDGVQVLRQSVEKAGGIEGESIRRSLAGATVETTRGRLYFRPIDNQLSCSAYFGKVADDPRYPMPIYADLFEAKGPEIWRPEPEIRAARAVE